jgi:hypothetical protein
MLKQVVLEFTGEFDPTVYPDLPEEVVKKVCEICEVMCASFRRRGGKAKRSLCKTVVDDTEYTIVLQCDGIPDH